MCWGLRWCLTQSQGAIAATPPPSAYALPRPQAASPSAQYCDCAGSDHPRQAGWAGSQAERHLSTRLTSIFQRRQRFHVHSCHPLCPCIRVCDATACCRHGRHQQRCRWGQHAPAALWAREWHHGGAQRDDGHAPGLEPRRREECYTCLKGNFALLWLFCVCYFLYQATEGTTSHYSAVLALILSADSVTGLELGVHQPAGVLVPLQLPQAR